MSDAGRKEAELTPEEIARQTGEPLPDREVMTALTFQPVPADDYDVLFPTDPTPKGVA